MIVAAIAYERLNVNCLQSHLGTYVHLRELTWRTKGEISPNNREIDIPLCICLCVRNEGVDDFSASPHGEDRLLRPSEQKTSPTAILQDLFAGSTLQLLSCTHTDGCLTLSFVSQRLLMGRDAK